MTEYIIIPYDYIKNSTKVTASSPQYAISKFRQIDYPAGKKNTLKVVAVAVNNICE